MRHYRLLRLAQHALGWVPPDPVRCLVTLEAEGDVVVHLKLFHLTRATTLRRGMSRRRVFRRIDHALGLLHADLVEAEIEFTLPSEGPS